MFRGDVCVHQRLAVRKGEGVFWDDNYVCGGSTSMYRPLYNSHYVDFGLIFFISPDQS